MRRVVFSAALLLCSAFVAPAADKYSGPRPPKADVPFLLHADNLVETETGSAKNETAKDAQVAVIEGSSSPVKTPLSEPIFLFQSNKLQADKIAAYKLEVKNGKRQVVVGHKKDKNIAKPIPVDVTRLDTNLYKIEINQTLENGEYTLSPEGSDETFSFQIY